MSFKDFFKKYKNVDHIVRLFVLYILILVSFLIGRKFLVPKSYGEFGAYRGDSPGEIAQSPVMHQGDAACGNCHSDPFAKKISSKHKNVRCEVCHGAGQQHMENPVENKMSKPKEREFCLLCHRSDPARPKSFPQIKPDSHNPGMWCVMCHEAHHPNIK